MGRPVTETKQAAARSAVTPEQVSKAAERVLSLCRAGGFTVATAESCTGGLLAAALTDSAGSSDVFERGFVTYSNAAKETVLGVGAAILKRYGAVSRETAEAMAAGALAHSPANFAVAITGIAGPSGGSADKPVGLVHFAAAARDGRHVQRERRFGDIGRRQVRLRSVAEALAMLEKFAAGGEA
jgi:nicotinamide-nucleotide amidase